MRAIKLTSHISADHRLQVQLPKDVPEGEAEVIVLVKTREDQKNAQRQSLEEFFQRLETLPIARRTKEEIDRSIEEERVGWER